MLMLGLAGCKVAVPAAEKFESEQADTSTAADAQVPVDIAEIAGDSADTDAALADPCALGGCDDGNVCTIDSCDAIKGCVHDAAAADGKPCNQSYCKAGACACEEQYMAIDVDDAGAKKVVCAPDYPVWGARPESPDAAWFTDNGDGTITDSQTKLVWRKAMPPTVKWADAKTYCDQLVLGGKADWRRPSAAELATLVDYGKSGPAAASVFAATTESNFYWSAVPRQPWTSVAWYVYFGNGYVNYSVVSDLGRVRCVR